MSKITYIDEVGINNKRVMLRVDINVSLDAHNAIADDARIKQILPSIAYLLQNKNRIILVSYLGKPKERDPKFSLEVVVKRLREYLPENKITLVDDFLTADKKVFEKQTPEEILVLENIRFYPEEKQNDQVFAQKLAALADVFVNDAFGQSHRIQASIVGVPKFLPSYGGLLMKKEITMLSKAIKNPKKPFVTIIGGAKISTKINLISRLIEMADYLLIGGGLANTFLCAQGLEIGKSYCEYEEVEKAKQLLFLAAQKNTAIMFPLDVVTGDPHNSVNGGEVYKVQEIPKGTQILDIGPETQAKFGTIIATAKTIVWNGPVGYFENPAFRRGTDFIYYAIAHNTNAISIVGGGDTLTAISKKEYLDKITHISTGGGAMLEFIEKGTLPGFEALLK